MELVYIYEGKTITVRADQDFQNDQLSLELIQEKDRIRIVTTTQEPIVFKSIRYNIKRKYLEDEYIFTNGYQSWTDSFEHTINDSIKGLKRIPKILIDRYSLSSYGDYGFYKYTNRRGILPSYSYSYIRRIDKFEIFGSLNERDGYTVFEHNTNNSRITVIKDIEGLIVDGEKTLVDIFCKSGAEAVIGEYFEKIDVAKPRFEKISGFSTGYKFGRNINHQLIIDSIESLSHRDFDIDLIMIGLGYEKLVGDWFDFDYEKFPYGLETLVQEIHNQGYQAGITIAPFIAETDSDVYKSNPDWFLSDGKIPVSSGFEWSGHHPLNLEIEAVREHIRSIIEYYLEIGFDVFKFDYLYATGMISGAKPRATIMYEAIEFLRDCLGDKMIIANQTPLFPAMGKVDVCQVSCNIGYDYDSTRVAKKLQRERVSTKNAIAATVYRRHLNNVGFISYSDVAVLDENSHLNEQQRRTVMMVETIFNGAHFISENVSNLEPNRIDEYNLVQSSTFDNVKVITHGKNIIIRYDNERGTNVLNIDLETGISK